MTTEAHQAQIWKGVALAALFSLGFACGCGRHGAVVLHQPFAPPSQQKLELASQWMFSGAAVGRTDYLLAFPLPGASEGPRDFLIYLSAPPGEGGWAVAADESDGVRGFLIQEVGKLKGKTTFTSGTVEVRGVWLRPHLRRLDLDLRCDDGTVVAGRAVVEEAQAELRSFEQHYAADIALLIPAAWHGEEAGDDTTPRMSTSP